MLDGARGLAKGFWTTLRHAAQPPITVPYPDVKRPVPAAFRGRHRLYRHEDGLERCIGCEHCEEACPVDAIRLGPEYELADFNRTDFVYTKEMLLDPEKYAPKRQYHADVDQQDPELRREIPEDLDLGEVYRTHRPLGAPIVSSPEDTPQPLA